METRFAFVSTRNLVGSGNTDGTPEIFFFNRLSAQFSQLTSTNDVFDSGGRLTFSAFNDNPCLNSNGSVVAFISNGNLTSENSDGNGEIYMANYSAGAFSNLRQITKTNAGTNHATVNILSYGRRLSRDGSILAFESLAADPKANSSTNEGFYAIFTYTVSSNTFNQVALRALPPFGDFGFIHFPTFTDYNGSLAPSTLIYASALNIKADGTFPTTATDGLNPNNATQIFATRSRWPLLIPLRD
jgi:hypothetical protein